MSRTPRDEAALITSLDNARRRHGDDADYYRGCATDTTDADVRSAFLREADDADGRAARRAQNIVDVKAGRD